ncbi:hypothetical protein HDU98_010262 [Podochytrium sp. JEL0797]|nr:hypothetical protein HDU98_010244 [Podochytrium sp. JEL0797]KAJ3076986.1 hypothetical protein HDU98_010262 [Podochytrium sp. JEL0797]
MNWFKAVAAYSLAFGFVFSPWGNKIQGRALYYCVFINTLNPPLKPLGAYLTTAIQLVACFAYSGALWAFIQAVTGYSEVAMACVMFVNVYVLSIARAISQERFYRFAVLGTILSFNSVASALDLNGPNTSGGNRFDHVYLQNILAACLIGIS